MQLDELYPLKGFTLSQIVKTRSGKVLLKAVSSSRSAVCPDCQTHSQKQHSVYARKPQALPCSDTPIQLVLSVHRYFCHNPSCTCKTLAERIPNTAYFYARRTIHLEALQVVDRWHLLHNFREKLREGLLGQLKSLKSDVEKKETASHQKRK